MINLRILWYQILFPSMMSDADNGIKEFIRRRIDRNLRELRNKINFSVLNKRNETELNTLKEYETTNVPALRAEEERKEIRSTLFFIWLIIAVEVFFNYYSTLLSIAPGEKSLFMSICRIGLAFLTTYMSVQVAARFFVILFHGEFQKDAKQFNFPLPKSNGVLEIFIVGFFMVSLEVWIFILTQKRAEDIEPVKGFQYYGFLLFAIILPLIGGYFEMRKKRSSSIFLAYQKNRKYVKLVKEADKSSNKDLATLKTKTDTLFENICSKYWNEISLFKATKLMHDRRKKLPVESLKGYEFVVEPQSYRDHLKNEFAKPL